MPDYLAFRQSYRNSLMHSPKGTTWKNHKYIRKDGKTYIYKERNLIPQSEDKRPTKKGIMDYATAIDEFVFGTDTFEVELDSFGNPIIGRYIDKPNIIERIKSRLVYGRNAIDDILLKEEIFQPENVTKYIINPQKQTKGGAGKKR